MSTASKGLDILDPQRHPLRPRPRLIQPRRGDIDPRTGVLDHQDTEPGLAKVACHEEAADVRRDATHGHSGDAGRLQEGDVPRMLGREGIRLEIAVEALAPDRVESPGVEAGKELGPRRAYDAVGRIEIVSLSEKAAVVRRVPVLAGVDAPPGQGEELVDRRDDLDAAGDG